VSRRLIEGCSIATMDGARTEIQDGYIIFVGDEITEVGSGAPPNLDDGERLDGNGLLATPGLINSHHHLYQWLTRGYAQESNLFEWLSELYPVWAGIDEDMEHAAAAAGLAALAKSGCSTSMDHHYIFPAGRGDLLAAEIDAAATVGLRFHPSRGSMDLGVSAGGLPPDEVTEATDAILSATADAIDRYHDSDPSSMLRIGVAPCSPFSATQQLMTESAALARSRGVRMHTHLAETIEEEEFCLDQFGVRPVEYLDKLGWLGDDVWLAHCVHLSPEEVGRFGAAATGVAHCPSSNARLGAGIAPVRSLLDASVPVGLGVDGAASNEACELNLELRGALLTARLRGGPQALSARDALAMGTIEGARCLGRSDEIGSLEAGKRADIALWNIDELGFAGIEDFIAALVLGPPRPVHTLIVAGRTIVEDHRLTTVDEISIAHDLNRQCLRLRRAGEV
jgi:cytosine/adenosine deaminase-related metal-dependent hydrolase